MIMKRMLLIAAALVLALTAAGPAAGEAEKAPADALEITFRYEPRH